MMWRGFSSMRRWPLGIALIADLTVSLLLYLLILALVLPLVGCRTTASAATSAAPPTSIVCAAFRPIRWSSKDTPETQKQARAHNAAGVSLCGWKP